MDDVTIALAIHVLVVVLWIGGVATVTTVLLPAVRRFKSVEERVAFFETIERRFAWQARGTTVLAGASGFYMMYRMNLWSAFLTIEYWWLDAMVAVWLVFTLMLFIIERGPRSLVRGPRSARSGEYLRAASKISLGTAHAEPRHDLRRRRRES